MKHSGKTKATALMFSAAAVAAGMLAGCTSDSAYCVYGPPSYFEDSASDEITEPAASETAAPETTAPEPPETTAPAKQINYYTMTEDEILNMPDEDLVALAQQFRSTDYHLIERPSYRYFVPDYVEYLYKIADQSAADGADAEQIAWKILTPLGGPPPLVEEKSGFWWYYNGDSMHSYLLVIDKAFADMETETLNAEVNEENMLRLAALRNHPGEYDIGAFVTDSGDSLTCTQYAVSIGGGDYGMSDTAVLVSISFSADKATGKLTDFRNDRIEYPRKAEIPDSYHPYPENE